MEVQVDHFDQTPGFEVLFGLPDIDAAEEFNDRFSLHGTWITKRLVQGRDDRPHVKLGKSHVPLLEPDLQHPNLRTALLQLSANLRFRKAGEDELGRALRVFLRRTCCNGSITNAQIKKAVRPFILRQVSDAPLPVH